MYRCLNIELHRLFRTKGFWIALVLGSAFSISHILTVVFPYASAQQGSSAGRINPMNVPFNVWMFVMGYDMYGWQSDIFFRMIPLFAAIPYANSYYRDISEGYIKNLQGRCKKEDYLVAKYITTFLSGGLIMTLPLILDWFGCSALLPLHQPAPTGMYAVQNILFYQHTWLYVISGWMIDFMIGGMYAVLGLIGTEFIANKYLLLIFPYVFVTLWQMAFQILDVGPVFDMVQISNPDLEIGNLSTTFLLIVLWIVVTFGVYFVRGRRRDELV